MAVKPFPYGTQVIAIWQSSHCHMALKSLPYGSQATAIWHSSHCHMALKPLPYGSQATTIWHSSHCHMAAKPLPYGSQDIATVMWHKFVTTPVEFYGNNMVAALKSWLRDFLSSCLCQLKISKIWRRALVVMIPKPGKPVGNPKSYRPIFLLCVPYKILKRLIYARIEPLIDPLLPKEQAGFQCEKSTIDQVVLLTQNIDDSFEAKKKAGAVFIDLTAAYDTVWHRGLICKLLRLLLDKHMVKMIMELVRNQSFTLTTIDSKQSRLRRLKNGIPQKSVLAPLLFNIYMYDLSMISRKFAYADDLALLHSSGNWKDLKGTLSQDMSTLSAYLQTWRLKLSHTKTVTAAFHLNNREAKCELKVYNNGRLLQFCPTPTYLGVKLDRSLTFCHHLMALRKKVSLRVTLLR